MRYSIILTIATTLLSFSLATPAGSLSDPNTNALLPLGSRSALKGCFEQCSNNAQCVGACKHCSSGRVSSLSPFPESFPRFYLQPCAFVSLPLWFRTLNLALRYAFAHCLCALPLPLCKTYLFTHFLSLPPSSLISSQSRTKLIQPDSATPGPSAPRLLRPSLLRAASSNALTMFNAAVPVVIALTVVLVHPLLPHTALPLHLSTSLPIFQSISLCPFLKQASS